MPVWRRSTTIRFLGIGVFGIFLLTYTTWQFQFLRHQLQQEDTGGDPVLPDTYDTQHFHACHDNQGQRQFFATAPHAVIIGALKAGTRSLFHYVRFHPRLVPAAMSEVHFFDRDPTWLHQEARITTADNGTLCELRQYYATKYFTQSRLYPRKMIAVEKTPDYIFHVGTAQHLKLMTQPWKTDIIVILRNPVERAWAQWKMNWEKEYEQRDFDTVIQEEWNWLVHQHWTQAPALKQYTLNQYQPNSTYSFDLPSPIPLVQSNAPFSFHRGDHLARGMYALQLLEWIQHFNNERIIVLLQEEMVEDGNAVFGYLCDRLNVARYHLAPGVLHQPYSHVARRRFHGNMTASTRDYLARFFEPYNHLLQQQFPELKLSQYWK